MLTHADDEPVKKRRPINLTIREDIIEDAKSLKLNTSKAAEQGIALAIKEARAQAWLAENKLALSAHNERARKNGTLLKPVWASD